MCLLQTLIERVVARSERSFSANTKHRCEDISGAISPADGHRVGLLTGDVAQKKRLRILENLPVATSIFWSRPSVAARGLHIPAVTARL